MPRLIQDVLKPLVEYKKWRGIDNLATDDMRVPPGFIRSANNVDIDNEEMLHTRVGILQELLSGKSHSLWSDEGDLCFFVKDDNLLQITDVYKSGGLWLAAYSTLLADVGPTKMNFVPIGHKTFFSNLVVNGYIEDDVAHAFPVIDNTKIQNSFKTRMVGGNLIEYFNSRLYAAQDEVVYHSDAGNPGVMDTRKNFFTLGGPVSMMLSVKDGFYISHGSKVAWLPYLGEVKLGGFDLAIPDFGYKGMLDVPAKKGSAIAIEKMKDIRVGVLGRCVIFSTSIGIFMGLPGGYLKDMTSEHYIASDVEEGSSMIRLNDKYLQYVFLQQTPAGISGNIGAIEFPTLEAYGTD